jgi:hypothetical protein
MHPLAEQVALNSISQQARPSQQRREGLICSEDRFLKLLQQAHGWRLLFGLVCAIGRSIGLVQAIDPIRALQGTAPVSEKSSTSQCSRTNSVAYLTRSTRQWCRRSPGAQLPCLALLYGFLVPLDQSDLSTLKDRGQPSPLDGFQGKHQGL